MKFRAAALALALLPAVQAATTINIATNVAVSSVKRFGVNLGNVTYYDSGQIMKELMFQNPGFEGLLYQSVVRVGATGNTATNAVEDAPWTGWPTGFWTGATYEFIYGAAKGRTGTVVTSINPRDPGANTKGTTYIFADSGPVPGSGDYLILRKNFSGDGGLGNGAAFTGWNTNVNGGATITTELADLPADTLGKQCVRLTATNTGQSATLAANCDTWAGVSFLQLNGQYQLTFKAKGGGGNNRISVTLRRGSGVYWINQTIQLTNDWQTITNTFTAAETGSALGNVSLQFSTWAGNGALLDDVSLRQTDSSPANTTPLRDPVINALTNLNPGILRIAGNWSRLGDSLDNELAAPFGRQRNYYSAYGIQQNVIHMGLHEFLDVCEFIGAEPWYTIPVTFSTQEMANLMDYLGGSTNTVYGAVRAVLGHPAPWTSAFTKIHLELGNENWNGGYRGGCIADTTALGARGNDLFAVVKSSPYYAAAKFNCVLGEQWVNPWRVSHTHNACTNHDTLTVAGYMASRIDSYATTEELFGSVFAEPEWWSKPNGLMYQDYTNVLFSSRPVPLSIYEININVPGGTITNSQAALTAYTPSLGAGLAVADHMLLALRELKARDQCLFSLGGYEASSGANQAFVWGTVHDMGVTDRKRPQFLACQLANRVLAGDCMQTTQTGDDPTWTVNNVNYVTYTNAHYLQSYAFASGTNRAAIVFNLHRTTALDVNFCGDLAPTGNITVSALTSVAITDNNENSNVVAVVTQTLTNFNAAAGLTLPPYSMSLLEWQATPAPTAMITVGVNTNAGGSVTGSGLFFVGSNAVLTATASNGWRFISWSDGSTNNPHSLVVASNTTYTANFAQQMATVTVLVNSNIAGSATGGGTFAVGSPQQISATPLWGWAFASWDDGNTDNPRTITVPQSNATYTAMFARQMRTVTVDVNTNVGGTTTGGGSYPVGTLAHITAIANTNWLFAAWDDGGLANPRIVLVPDSNVTYTAIFGAEVTLTGQANPATAGGVSGGDRYPAGLYAVLVAWSNANWAFSSWTCGDVTNTDNPLLITVTTNATWTANFVPLGTLTVVASPTNGGDVTGGGTYVVGSNVQLSATASNGWRFISWNDGSTNNPRAIVVATNQTYSAVFAPLGNVVVLANPTNAGSVSGGGAYVIGSNTTLAATPSNGWLFANWNRAVTNNPWTFVLTGNVMVCTANFARPVAVNVATIPSYAGSVSGGGLQPSGNTLTLAATAAPGWLFSRWSDGNTNASRSITVPATNITYTATFAIGLGVALNASNLTWTTGGSANWSVQTATSRDGIAARSGAISAGQQTWFQTTTNGPLSLMFWWKVSSAPTNYLQFYINTQLVSQISGNVDWTQYVTFLGSTNQYTLKWVYAKNSATVSGSDAGFVDQVTVLPCPYATNVPQLFFQDSSGLLASWILNSTGGFQFARVLANTGGWALKTAGDINGDGVSDLLFQNAASDTGGWFLNADGSVRDARFWFNIGGWEIKACADYEGTGRAQLFFQTARGDVAYWRLDTNGAFQSAVALGNMGAWKLRGAGDLDGDHKADLFWQNAAGQVAIWYHNTNGTIRSALAFNTGEWGLCGVADVDADGVCDLIWQTPDSRTGGWFMQTNGVARDARFWWPTGGWKLKAAGR